MEEVIWTSQQVARKSYPCDASIWIYETQAWQDYDFTYAELRIIAKMRRNGWRILKGQRYIKQVSVLDGKLIVWRGLPEIHQICLKYDIYEYI